MPNVIIDDSKIQDEAIVGEGWERRTGQRGAFNDTILSCEAQNLGQYRSYLQLDFTGPVLSVVGRPSAGLKLDYSLNGQPTRQDVVINVEEADIGKDGVVLWRLPPSGLSASGTHNITIWPHGGEFNLDYITTSPQTAGKAGDVLYTDDLDELTIYEGDWIERTAVPALPALPFKGSWTQTTNNRTSLTTDFTGESIEIYGFLNHAAGRLRVLYDIDGRAFNPKVHFDGMQEIDNEKWENMKLYEERLPGGTHTLKVTVVEITENQSFNFDFMTHPLFVEAEAAVGPKVGLAPMIGGIVGGLLATAIVVVLFWLYQRCKLKQMVDLESAARAYARQALEDLARRHSDWEGPSLEPAPPPWSPPLNPNNEPPPPAPEAWRRAIEDRQMSEVQNVALPSPPPTPVRSRSPVQAQPTAVNGNREERSTSGSSAADVVSPPSLAQRAPMPEPASPRANAADMRPEHPPPYESDHDE